MNESTRWSKHRKEWQGHRLPFECMEEKSKPSMLAKAHVEHTQSNRPFLSRKPRTRTSLGTTFHHVHILQTGPKSNPFPPPLNRTKKNERASRRLVYSDFMCYTFWWDMLIRMKNKPPPLVLFGVLFCVFCGFSVLFVWLEGGKKRKRKRV